MTLAAVFAVYAADLSVDDAVALAINSPSMRSSELELELAKKKYDASYFSLMPSL